MANFLDRLTALSDRYRIERELGQGGMATVYLAEDFKHRRKVAVKVLRPELAAIIGGERFLKEIEVTANLQHPHILPLFDSGEADGLLYYVMPYVEGESLRTKLDREGLLPVDEALDITKTIAYALDYAHRQNVIHRDIKPENILLREGQPLVADFGIALAVSAVGGTRMTETGLSLGTPHYMSPEQAAGERQIDNRSDIYSLGCVLYELLAGAPPHTGPSTQSIIAKVITDKPRPLRSIRDTVPEHVERAVTRTLSKVAVDRYKTAGQFAEALAHVTKPGAAEKRSVPFWLVASVVGSALTVLAIGLQVTRSRVVPAEPINPIHTQLTFSGNAFDPAVSPDGSFLAYREYLGPGWRLLVQDLSGGEPLEILRDTVGIFGPILWSPDGTRLLANVASNNGLYTVPRLGGQPGAMFQSDPAKNVTYDYSPDGQSIVVVESWLAENTRQPSNRVIMIPLDGDTAPVDTLTISEQRYYDGIDWSPTGDWLALRAPQQSAWRIDIANVEGEVMDSLVAPSGNQLLEMHWSSDGTGLYYVEGKVEDYHLRRVPINVDTGHIGGPPTTVMTNGIDLQTHFAVSSDGSRLFYTRKTFRSHLWLINLDRDAQRGTAASVRLTSGTAAYTDPSMARDVATLAYARTAGNDLGLYVTPLGVGSERRVAAKWYQSRLVTRWQPTRIRGVAWMGADGSQLSRWHTPARRQPINWPGW